MNLSFRRFEFKYHIPRAICDRIIPQLMNYMVWDEYVKGAEYYEVHSIYMDTHDFKCYHEKVDGIMNRKKPRLRSYVKEVGDDTNLFLELKRKSGEVILKDRVVLKRTDLAEFVDNPFFLLRAKDSNESFINEFLYEYTKNNMRPRVKVSYKRTPFFSRFDRAFRLTFDYDIEACGVDNLDFSRPGSKIYDDLVVMEVKFNGAMPRWFHDIIEEYSLSKHTFSKYCSAIDEAYGLPSYF